MLISNKIENPFPVIVQRSLFDNSDLNLQLEKFVDFIISTRPDVTNQKYIATENAKQVNCNLLVEYYKKEDCITQLLDDIINPCVKTWADEHFKKLIERELNPQLHLESWATLYEPGSWQTPHIHRDKLFTGIYYFKMNESNGNEGALVLQNPHLQSTQPLLGGWNTHIEILPQEGELIIIPSWISHFPKPFSKGKRGAIVFDGEFLGEKDER